MLFRSDNSHTAAITNETDSVASSVNSIDDRSPPEPPVISNNAMDVTPSFFSSSSPLTKYNQSALCVKAHLEQFKGNTKKSLILCTEAALGSTTNSTNSSTTSMTTYGNHSMKTNSNMVSSSTDNVTTTAHMTDDVITTTATPTTSPSWYDAIHSNNLAVIYATNGRKHMALHGMIKALRANTAMMMNNEASTPTEASETSFSNVFLTDGTVKPDISTSLLYNTAICCLRTRNYMSAYECMVSCICHNHSHVFHNRTRCYLYLSDACLGIHAQQTKEHAASPYQQHPIRAFVDVNG